MNTKWLHINLGAILSVLLALLIWVVTQKAPTVIVANGSQASLVTTSTSTATSNHLPPYWRERLLALLGAPRSTQNLRLLHAWGVAEGGTAQWNALNTTYVLSYGESWSYNSSSVQNYFKPTAGVAATALTLVQGTYSCIVGALQASQLTASGIVNKCSTTFQTWGTSPSTMLKVLQETP